MIYDTCPTLASLLGLPRAREWDGRIIEEALAVADRDVSGV